MSLKWYYAGDDVAAKYENIVFRLHKDFITVKRPKTTDKQEVQVFDLQYRKLDNLDFRSLGYYFFVDSLDYGIPRSRSVDDKKWNKDKIDEIIERSEEILLNLHYIDIASVETEQPS